MKDLFSSAALNRLILNTTLLAGRIAGFVTRHRGLIQTLGGLLAFALGFWGWMIQKPPAHWWTWETADNFFRTLQLITLQFPADVRGPVPVPLQIARLALPLVAALASFQILVGSITRPARLALLQHSSDHIVVCGSESLTEAALRSLASRGRQVVAVVASIGVAQRQALEGFGLTIVERDPRRPETIKSLRLSHASAVFLTSDDDVENLSVAMLAFSANHERPDKLPPLVVATRIDRESLATELDAVFGGLSHRHRARYCRLCPDREGVRLELTRYAPVLLKADLDAPSHVLVVGLSGNWQQIVMQLVTALQDHPDKRGVLTFVVSAAEAEAVQRWRDSRPEYRLLVDISIMLRQSDALLPSDGVVQSWREDRNLPQLAVVLRQASEAIAVALALRSPTNALGVANVPILVHQSREDRLLSRLGSVIVDNRDLTRMVAIGGLVRVESIERVLDRKGDEMAISLHAHYLDAAQSLAGSSSMALKAWDDLSENLKDANRAAADHAPILLAAIGIGLAQAAADVDRVTLSSAELECLARIEHRRWMADRVDRGWRYGKIRDDRLSLHPAIVAFEELDERDKERDRNAISVLLSLLNKRGLILVRRERPI